MLLDFSFDKHGHDVIFVGFYAGSWKKRSEKLEHADEIMLSDNVGKDEIVTFIENLRS